MRKAFLLFILFLVCSVIFWINGAQASAPNDQLEQYLEQNLTQWVKNVNQQIDHNLENLFARADAEWVSQDGIQFYRRHAKLFHGVYGYHTNTPWADSDTPSMFEAQTRYPQIAGLNSVEQEILRNYVRTQFWLFAVRARQHLIDKITINREVPRESQSTASQSTFGDSEVYGNILLIIGEQAKRQANDNFGNLPDGFAARVKQRIGNNDQIKQCMRRVSLTAVNQNQAALGNRIIQLANMYRALIGAVSASGNTDAAKQLVTEQARELERVAADLRRQQPAGTLKSQGEKIDALFMNPAIENCNQAQEASNSSATVIGATNQSASERTTPLGLRSGKIGVEAVRQSIAVFLPGIFGQSADEAGYRAIGPETFLEKIRVFLLDLSIPAFILLVVLGGLFMILAPFSKGYIDLGKKYIYWAVIGYVVLLIASAAIALLRGLFGSPR